MHTMERFLAPLLALVLAAGPLAARAPSSPRGVRSSATLTTVAGEVRDLSLDPSGRILYCTEEGEVGRIDPTTGVVTLIAGVANGLPVGLEGIVETPSGDIVVVQDGGDMYLLPGGMLPVTPYFKDTYQIVQATDLVVDAGGDLLVCSKTPSVGARGIDWIHPDVNQALTRWAYYLVEHGPLSLAADPLTGDLLLADANGSGALRTIDIDDDTRPTSPVDTTTSFQFDPTASDGDIAVEASGDAYVVSGGTVYFVDRSAGMTTPLLSGLAQLHGAVIGASSPGVTSPTGWSLFLAESSAPTQILEVGGVGVPAGVGTRDLGTVPNQGRRVLIYNQFRGLRAYELSVDREGRLLVGGDVFGTNFQVRRIDPDTMASSTVADQTNGLFGRIEGITAEQDGTIHAMNNGGVVQEIHESPTTVTTVFADPLGQVIKGEDLLSDRDGTFFIADREGFGSGEVVQVAPGGTATSLVRMQESRSVTADPFTASLLTSQWHCTGFCGTIDRWSFGAGTLSPLPGLAGINYSNDSSYGDGDSAMDVEGQVYTCSEDDWRVTRYEPAKQRFALVGSMYLNHPTGVAITRSTPSSGSTTGWSLYVSDLDYLWEIPSVPPPAPRLLDRSAPPVGDLLGWFPRGMGRPRSMIADPAGGGLFVTTDSGRLLRIDTSTGAYTAVLMPPGATDITALAALGSGHVAVATSDGIVFEVNPLAGYATTLIFADPLNQLASVRGMTADAQDRLLIVDRAGTTPAAKLWRLSGGSLQLLTNTSRGLRPAIDPDTGDVFVTEQGSASDGKGEILRVETYSTPVLHGHWLGQGSRFFQPSATDGAIVFDAAGDFYVTEGELGHVVRVDRATGARTVVAGNYDQPVSLALAPGRPGVAGPQGTSLFVLDGWAVHEVGVDGLPAGPPPAANPGLAPPADLRVAGDLMLSTNVPVKIQSAANAGRVYVLIPTLSGEVPGFPLSALGMPDQRVLPSNPDMLWSLIGDPVFLPASIGVLDPQGKSPTALSIFIGPSPSVYNLNLFVDLAWIVFDPSATNRIGSIGGTAQLFLGN